MTSVSTTTIHNTFSIERSFPKPLDRVFAAFADPAKKRRWYAEGVTHDVEMFEMDFRVGGIERTKYRFNASTPFQGVVLSSEGVIQDIVPNQRIVMTSTMSFGDKRISTSLITIELVDAGEGTDLILTHQGAYFEGADG